MNELQEQIESAMPAVMARIKQETLTRIEREGVEIMVATARKAAEQWAIDNLVPEIKAQLDAGKAGMVAKASEISGNITDEIGKALVKSVTEKLSQSWNVRKLTEAIFN